LSHLFYNQMKIISY